MRINKFVALASGLSRRKADRLVESGQVFVNGAAAQAGQQVEQSDTVTLGSRRIVLPYTTQTIMLNKPAGYVCSRDGQGSATIYDLLPPELHHLKPVGRLDKDSSGLLLLTNDGQLAHELTHPKFEKEKVYEVELDKPLVLEDKAKIEQGVKLEDGLSALRLKGDGKDWTIAMNEGRNRQIRRTFAALGYKVAKLHRTQFGEYELASTKLGGFRKL